MAWIMLLCKKHYVGSPCWHYICLPVFATAHDAVKNTTGEMKSVKAMKAMKAVKGVKQKVKAVKATIFIHHCVCVANETINIYSH